MKLREIKEKMKDYDLAYAFESMARAYSISKDKDKSEKWYNKAKTSGSLIASDCDKESFIFDLKSRNIGVLITDHNVRETLTITDRAYLLYEGDILKSGSARELTEDEEARRLYLGSKFKMDFIDA